MVMAKAGRRQSARPGSALWLAVLAGAIVLASPLGAQQAYPTYLTILKTEYVSARAGGSQILRMKLNVAKEIPVGTKILLELEDQGDTLEDTRTVFELRDRNRTGITFDWKFRKPVAPGTYQVTVSIPMQVDPDFVGPRIRQSKQVKDAFKEMAKTFPPGREPWIVMYFQPKDHVKIGTKAEWAALRKRVCDFYDGAVGALVRSKKSFDKTMDDVLAEKKYVRRGQLVVAQVADWLQEWQLDHAKIQRRILEMPLDNRAIHQQSLEAHRLLMEVGYMVAKDAMKKVTALEAKYSLEEKIRTRPDEKEKKDSELYGFFSTGNWRGKTDREALNSHLDQIFAQVCPQPEKPPADKPPADKPPADKPPAEKPPAEKPPADKPPATRRR